MRGGRRPLIDLAPGRRARARQSPRSRAAPSRKAPPALFRGLGFPKVGAWHQTTVVGRRRATKRRPPDAHEHERAREGEREANSSITRAARWPAPARSLSRDGGGAPLPLLEARLPANGREPGARAHLLKPRSREGLIAHLGWLPIFKGRKV